MEVFFNSREEISDRGYTEKIWFTGKTRIYVPRFQDKFTIHSVTEASGVHSTFFFSFMQRKFDLPIMLELIIYHFSEKFTIWTVA